MPIPVPDKMYRYFTEAEHADQFVAGRILISTLEKCRGHECDVRRDEDEGIMEQALENVIYSDHTLTPPPPESSGVAWRHRPGSGTKIFLDNTQMNRISNAFVLCLSLEFEEALQDRFGRYVVEISCLPQFVQHLTYGVSCHFQITNTMFGPVKYVAPFHEYGQPPPGLIGFVKNPYFRDEKEARILWVPGPIADVRPGFLTMPEAGALTRRIA